MLTAYFNHERIGRHCELIYYGFFRNIAVHLHLNANICFACLGLALAASHCHWTKSKTLDKILGVLGIALVASVLTSFVVALLRESYLLMFSGPSKYRNGMLYLVCYLNIALFGSFGIAFTIVQGKAVCQRLIEEGRALPWYFSSIVSNILAAVELMALFAVDVFVTVRLSKLAIIIFSIISFHDAILNPNRSLQQNAEALLNNIAFSCYAVIAVVVLLILFILLRRRPSRSEFLRMYYQALENSVAVFDYSLGIIYLLLCGLIILIIKCPPSNRLTVCGTFFLGVLLAWKSSGFNLMRALLDFELRFLGPSEISLLPAQPSSLIPIESVALLVDAGCETQSTNGCDIAQIQEITTQNELC